MTWTLKHIHPLTGHGFLYVFNTDYWIIFLIKNKANIVTTYSLKSPVTKCTHPLSVWRHVPLKAGRFPFWRKKKPIEPYPMDKAKVHCIFEYMQHSDGPAARRRQEGDRDYIRQEYKSWGGQICSTQLTGWLEGGTPQFISTNMNHFNLALVGIYINRQKISFNLTRFLFCLMCFY